MADDRREVECVGGEHMIQDRDHMCEMGQIGGGARHGGGRQPEQSQADSRRDGSGQQGGAQHRKTGEYARRYKFL